MKIKKTLLTAAVALSCLSMTAQGAGEATEYVFNPHFYGQLQFGGQETLGEGDFGELFAPNAQIAVGYQITPLFGLRLGANAWESKGTMEFKGSQDYWKWNYVAPALDFTVNMSNLFCGYNPTRLCDVNIFAGIGANIAWGNDEAVAYNAANLINGKNILRNIWDGNQSLFLFRFGGMIDFRLTERLSLGLELQANVLSDKYNSKQAGNADWYFNGLVGVKYIFGKPYNTRAIAAAVAAAPVVAAGTDVQQTVVEERIVEKPVEVIREVVVNQCPQEMQRDIFFTLSNTKISLWEMQKVRDIAEFMRANPDTNVTITGYADAGTGTLAINTRLAKQRAQAVYDALTKDYGIAASRITVDSMTDHAKQPFAVNELNRVAICVVK